MQEEGIIGIFYERKHREFSRVHGFMKIVVSVGNADVVCASKYLLVAVAS